MSKLEFVADDFMPLASSDVPVARARVLAALIAADANARLAEMLAECPEILLDDDSDAWLRNGSPFERKKIRGLLVNIEALE